MKTFLTSKVREYTLELRQLYSSTMNALDESSGEAMTFAAKREIALISARRRKEEQVRFWLHLPSASFLTLSP